MTLNQYHAVMNIKKIIFLYNSALINIYPVSLLHFISFESKSQFIFYLYFHSMDEEPVD